MAFEFSRKQHFPCFGEKYQSFPGHGNNSKIISCPQEKLEQETSSQFTWGIGLTNWISLFAAITAKEFDFFPYMSTMGEIVIIGSSARPVSARLRLQLWRNKNNGKNHKSSRVFQKAALRILLSENRFFLAKNRCLWDYNPESSLTWNFYLLP